MLHWSCAYVVVQLLATLLCMMSAVQNIGSAHQHSSAHVDQLGHCADAKELLDARTHHFTT